MSEHFTYNELDVENYPSLQSKADWVLENILEPIRAYFNMPVNIHDGYRSPEHNIEVGGKTAQTSFTGKPSFHLWWSDEQTGEDVWAVDFDISGHSLTFVFDTIRLGINNFNNSKIDKIILELNPETKTPRCVHIQGFIDITKARHLAYKGYTGACTKYEPVEFRLST